MDADWLVNTEMSLGVEDAYASTWYDIPAMHIISVWVGANYCTEKKQKMPIGCLIFLSAYCNDVDSEESHITIAAKLIK